MISLDQRSGTAGRAHRWRGAALPAVLALTAFVMALVQRPGELAADTKIDLHVDPLGFLADAASIWSSSGGLGQVQAGQYAGYLFPMGPFFALGDLIGLAPWLVHRLWIGTVLAVAAWGTVKLLDATLGRPRGVAHAVAGLTVLLNPYVVVFLDRTSVTLLGYAALPWLLLAVLRASRDPGGWRWPAVFALVLASTGGGVNAAVTAWLLLAPLLLAIYEVARRRVSARDMAKVGARTALLSVAASAWWIVPVAEHAAHGLNFLPFTETVGAIWGTTSMSESLRLLGYWIVYLGTGYGAALTPYFETGATMLFEPLPVLATLLLPALALGGFALSRRWEYGPFFLGLVLLGALVMSAGFPEGAPLRRVLTGVYNAAEPLQFMRTTYKAGPLVALGMACLLGVAAHLLWARTRSAAARALPAVALLAVLLGAAWPAVQGRAIDDQIAFDDVPAPWRAAAADLDRELPRGTRALVLPGQLFPFYRWGTTQDPVLPALADRPVAVRGAVPFADLHAADLLVAVDSLIQQRRLLPGQLPPLLDLLGVGAVVTGADDDMQRSGSIDPREAARVLASQPGFAEPQARYGEVARSDLPQVRRYDLPSPEGMVRVLPRRGATVVDGSAEGLVGLAALGALPGDRTLFYAADLSPKEIRAAIADGGEVVVTDTNRRRTFLSSRHRQNAGPVLGAEDEPPKDAAMLDPFAERGADAQTVAVLEGARSLESPLSPNFPQFPEHRPFAAFDGDPSTYWVADRYIDDDRRWIEIDFGRPRDVRVVRLLPQRETRTRVTEVEIAGRRHPVGPGWNTLQTGLSDVRRLKVRISALDEPPERAAGAGAIAEIRIPGVRVEERLRPPTVAEEALAKRDLDRGTLSYVFQRVTGDDPYRRVRRPDPDRGSVPRGANAEAALVAEPGDPERAIRRTFTVPAAMRVVADGWASVAPEAPDRAGTRPMAVSCGALRIRIDGRSLPMRVAGRLADFDAGRPLRVRSCGRPVAVERGPTRLEAIGTGLRLDVLRLRDIRSAGPREDLVPVGRVLDSGNEGRGRRDDVRVQVTRPAWLVLGESFNRGWRATCDGRDLGSPRVVNGYANGWPVDPGCRDVSFEYAPNDVARWSYVFSGVGVAAMLAALVVTGWRRRRRGLRDMETPTAQISEGAPDEPSAWPLRKAALAGLVVLPIVVGLFSIRAGLAVAPLVAIVLWRGIGARTLALAAGALLAIVVPAIQLGWLPEDRGGFNGRYATDVIAAHWAAVAAWVLLALALWRTLSRARAHRGDRAREQPGAARTRSPA